MFFYTGTKNEIRKIKSTAAAAAGISGNIQEVATTPTREGGPVMIINPTLRDQLT